MIQKSTLDFLKGIKKNNNRDWFNRNKHLYEYARNDFEAFIGELINKISTFDKSVESLSPRDCMFRIYKDTRFSKDKTPYKTNMGAAINEGGRKVPMPGYYFHLEPGGCFLAGGLHMPLPDVLLRVRNVIAKDKGEFRRILNNKEFKKYWGLWENKLKTAPKGFPKDHTDIELLKYKSFVAVHEFDDKLVLTPRILDYSAKAFKTLKPMIDYLGRAVK